MNSRENVKAADNVSMKLIKADGSVEEHGTVPQLSMTKAEQLRMVLERILLHKHNSGE